MRTRIGLILALALGTGCLESSVTTCDDGVLCPAGTACSSQGCVLPEQVDACDGLVDGDRCEFSGVSSGRCVDGVCVSFGCGNDVVEADQGERCDDGNTISGDGCRADCQKIEACGDEIEDEGEACDDGNANPADGCDACVETAWTATALVGGDLMATALGLAAPQAVAVDRRGNAYFADRENHRVRRVDATGAATVVAGTGADGYSGDGGPATSARLGQPVGVAVDGLDNVFVADAFRHVVRRIDGRTGIITTVAGNGVGGYGGDNGAATLARLQQPEGVAVDGQGNLFIADAQNYRIRRVDATTGVITTVAGIGTPGPPNDGGQATSAGLIRPVGVALDAAGNLFIADQFGQRVRRVAAVNRTISTVAGDGTYGYAGDDGAAASAMLAGPTGVAVDEAGNLYISDRENHRVRRVAGGIITTYAGTGVAAFAGDGGPASTAALALPYGVAVDLQGHVYVSDSDNDRIRRVDAATGDIATVAGSGDHGGSGYEGTALTAGLAVPIGLALDGAGNLYLADTDNSRIRRLDAGATTFAPVAGNGDAGLTGDGELAVVATMNTPRAVAVDAAGNVFFADSLNHRIRRVDATTGVITTVAGTVEGFDGDGGPAIASLLSSPLGVAVDAAGNLVIADSNNHRIRRVDATTQQITTIAGGSTPGSTGDNGPATGARLFVPQGLAFDADGHLYIADSFNARVRRIDAVSGDITTVAGSATSGSGGDGLQATSAQLSNPTAVALDGAGNLYIADRNNHRVRRVDAAGVITTVAGTGTLGELGDGGLATAARLQFPSGVAADAAGNVYVADTDNHRLRRIDPGGVITTVGGAIDPDGMGPLDRARLADPRALVRAPAFTLIAGGATGTAQVVDAAAVRVVAGRYPHAQSTGALARFRSTSFGSVGGVAYDDAAGAFYLTESSAHRILRVTVVDPDDARTWTIAPLTGVDATAGFADGAAATARFRAPTGLFLDDATRILYVADTGNHVIRAIDLETSQVTTVAGTPATLGFFGDTGPATAAYLYAPEAITRCGNGDVFIADTGNHRVRRIDDAGLITTVLGDGVAASSGQGSPAEEFPVNAPRGLACDASGNLYVTSSTTVRQLSSGDTGIVDGTGAVTSIFGEPPRITLPASVTFCLTGLAVVDADTVQITDSCTGMLIELARAPR